MVVEVGGVLKVVFFLSFLSLDCVSIRVFIDDVTTRFHHFSQTFATLCESLKLRPAPSLMITQATTNLV